MGSIPGGSDLLKLYPSLTATTAWGSSVRESRSLGAARNDQNPNAAALTGMRKSGAMAGTLINTIVTNRRVGLSHNCKDSVHPTGASAGSIHG